MPKVKVPRKSTSIDMTAMCDVSFLLLTFFMLTSKFRPPEAVPIDLPASRSQTKIDKIMTISIDKNNRIFFGMPDKESRAALLENMMAIHPEWKFNEVQKKNFEILESFGIPQNQLASVLEFDAEEYKDYDQPGIPNDTLRSELAEWVTQARYADPRMKIAIKGDKNTSAKTAREVINTLTEKVGVHSFNLITTLAGSSE